MHADSQFDALTDMVVGENWTNRIMQEITAAAENGWVLIFVSSSSMRSQFIGDEMRLAKGLTEKIVPVLFDQIELPPPLLHLERLEACSDPEKAPAVLVDMLLRR